MTLPDTPDAPDAPCPICAGLGASATAFQKYGREEGNTYLPAAADQLVIVRDEQPYGSRKLQLRQCPACATSYLYRTDDEYLVNGAEDEEALTRLTAAEAAAYRDRPAPA